MKIRHGLFQALAALLLLVACSSASAAETDSQKAAAGRRLFTAKGLPADESFFPIAVWLQSPRNAARYKTAGINLFVGLWRGLNAEQLSELEKAGMPVICSQNAFALSQPDNPIIAGWMHGDEPDNAQSLGKGKGYGPPIATKKIVEDYERIRAADPTRPVLLNLGQGVAWDNYIGRGVRRNHPEDYPEYLRGCDIASFDIYPVVHDSPEIQGRLEYVPRGVERLLKWTDGAKPAWNCIECTHISEPARKATAAQVRSEVWMSLIRGSRGLIYFVHEFKPTTREAALLDDPEMLAAITALNRQIRELAPVLNSPTITNGVEVQTSAPAGTIAAMLKRHGKATWLFCANLHPDPARATFSMQELNGVQSAEVLGEDRTVSIESSRLADEFQGYGVHLYRVGSAEN